MPRFDFQRYGVWMSARSNYKVVFKLTLVAVIDQINSGVDVLVPHLGVSRNIGPPFLGVIAHEIVGLAGQFTKTHHKRFGVRAHKLHVHFGRRQRLVTWVSRLVSSDKVVGPEEKLFR